MRRGERAPDRRAPGAKRLRLFDFGDAAPGTQGEGDDSRMGAGDKPAARAKA